MSAQADHLENLSLAVSAVFNDIAVNGRYVEKRRRTWLTVESMDNITFQLQGDNMPCYMFGSQIEGTTTLGLNSDYDHLHCHSQCRAIQRWSDWQHGPDIKLQLLMLQDDTTYPGHCLLQLVRPDVPLPMENFQHEHFTTDSSGRALLRHSLCVNLSGGAVRHGPAAARQGQAGYADKDTVMALKCLTWPQEAEPWLHQQTVSGWPSEHLRRSAADHRCFLVPVASKTGVYPDLEWRISTAYAERCLMFSLNITQIRCYILLKKIHKTHIKPVCGDAISSYIRKTVLFHTIATSDVHDWNSRNLISCFIQCIETLREFVLTGNCPHFIITRNNLLDGKLTAELKHKVMDVLCKLTENIEQCFFRISTDDFGRRLQSKLRGAAVQFNGLLTRDYIAAEVASVLTINFSNQVQVSVSCCLKDLHYAFLDISLVQFLRKCFHIESTGSNMDKKACNLITPLFCSSLGCVRASADIQSCGTVSPETFRWFTLGLNSDMSSSRLKLASVLYCTGDLQKCEVVLTDLERQFREKAFNALCACCKHEHQYSFAFGRLCDESDDTVSVFQHNVAFCVWFLPGEDNCIPAEMKYEMFRSTQEDLPYRDENDNWMDWAVVDSQPYLYFLQYKMYSQLQRPAEKQAALINLDWTIDNAINLGHKETALNLLGQCMEQENRVDTALKYYQKSLNVRARNNAAKWHIFRIFAELCC